MKFKKIILAVVACSLLASCAASITEQQAEPAKNISHLHIGHVLSQWQDTPEQQGLMTIAIAEAEIAAVHAKVAANQPNNLAWMQLHTKHVVHAIDPATQSQGPGKGYGLIRAAKGVAKHITVAADMPDASPAVKLHSIHVSASAKNVVSRGQEILVLSQQVLNARQPAPAAAMVTKIKLLTEQISVGNDANGDGKISWHEGEGGLEESNKHAQIIAQLEKLN